MIRATRVTRASSWSSDLPTETCRACPLWPLTWSTMASTPSWRSVLRPFKRQLAASKSVPVIALDLESDPVGSGFVASLARPGGNVSGVFLDFPEFSAKCLQLLIEAVSTLASVGVLWDPTTGALQRKWVEAAAQQFGVSVQVFEARRVADIA